MYDILDFIALSLENSKIKKFLDENLYEEEFIEIDEEQSKHYLILKKLGVEIIISDGTFGSITLYDTKNGFLEFQGKLPFGIKFGNDVNEIQTLIKQNPSKKHLGGVSMFGVVNPWQRYDFETYSLRVEFSFGKLSKVTLMSKRFIEVEGL